jgi:hypothetical protein
MRGQPNDKAFPPNPREPYSCDQPKDRSGDQTFAAVKLVSTLCHDTQGPVRNQLT